MKCNGFLLTGALSGLFLTFCACAKKPAPPPPPPPYVGVATVIRKNVPIYGEWVTSLAGYNNANIQPQVTGYLIKQNYREGSLVHKGEVLFEVDPRPFQAVLDQAAGQLAQAHGQLAQAQAQLGLAIINVNRDTPLFAAHAIPQSQLDTDVQTQKQYEALVKSDQANIEAATAAVQTAKINLGFTQVLSLLDGIAGIAATQIGSLVSPTTVLTTVSQVEPIKVYFPISEQEYLALANRAHFTGKTDLLRPTARVPLQLTLANGEVYKHSGSILFADRQVNEQTGTITIVGAFTNPGNILRPGQWGRIRAETTIRRGALLVPQSAVSQLQGRYQVAVVGADNRVSIRNVEPGERAGTLWIINSGLKAGECVVSEGASKVKDGEVVHPVPHTRITG
jgi:RND family efflux transporter MFP subunit